MAKPKRTRINSSPQNGLSLRASANIFAKRTGGNESPAHSAHSTFSFSTSVNGTTISSANGLTNQTAGAHAGDQFAITYVDQYGAKHSATVALTGWAK